MAPSWYSDEMAKYEHGLICSEPFEGSGYFDSEGNYVYGPDDFDGEDDWNDGDDS